MAKIEQVKIMEKDKQLFTDSFNICWKLLKTRNYYISNRENNNLFSELSIIYGQNMYEAMLVTMNDIIKSNVNNITVNENSVNESNKTITNDKTIDKCSNDNNNSVIVDKVDQVKQNDKVTSIINKKQDVPLKRKLSDDFINNKKKPKPSEKTDFQIPNNKEKNKTLDDNCKKPLNVKNEKLKSSNSIFSNLSNVNSTTINKTDNSVKKNNIISTKANTLDNDNDDDDDIIIIENKTNNEKSPVKLKTLLNKTPTDKNNKSRGDEIKIIESKQTDNNKIVNDITSINKTQKDDKTKKNSVADDTTSIQTQQISNNKTINEKTPIKPKTPIKSKTPINKTQKDDKTENNCGDDITIIESKQISSDKTINEKTQIKPKTSTNQTPKDDKTKNPASDGTTLIESKQVNTNKTVNEKTPIKSKTPIKPKTPINKTQKDDKTKNNCGDDITLVKGKQVSTNKTIIEKTPVKSKAPINNTLNDGKTKNQVNDNNDKQIDTNKTINEKTPINNKQKNDKIGFIDKSNSNKYVNFENTIQITSVKSLAPVVSLNEICVVTLEDDEPVQINEIEVLADDCVDITDNIVNITNNLNNINEVEQQIYTNDISSRYIKEIIDYDHTYSKKIPTENTNNDIINKNYIGNYDKNKSSNEKLINNKNAFVTVNFCDVNKIEDINFTDSYMPEEFDEINSANDEINYDDSSIYYDHDYYDDGDDDDDNNNNNNNNDSIDKTNDNEIFNSIGRIVNDISFEEKKRIVKLAEKHPNWTIKMLRKKSGCEKLLGQHQLNNWKKMVERGGSSREIRVSFNNWIYNKCLESYKQNKKITNKKIQNWGLEAKKLSYYKNLKFFGTYQWVENFKRNYRITGSPDNLIIDPQKQNDQFTLSRVLVPYELKVKVVNLANEHKDWSLDMLKKHSGCNYLQSFSQITSWKHLIKKGQSLWDKYKKLNQWIYNKYTDYQNKNKKVTDRMLISWRNEAKKVLQFNELPKINHNYQWVRTFKRDFNIT